MVEPKSLIAERLKYLPQESFWVTFGRENACHKALNMGMGVPSFPIPGFIADSVTAALKDIELHQMCDSRGHEPLRHRLAHYYNTKMNQTIDKENIILGVGVTHLLACALLGVLEIDDEVICFDPAFDIYEPQVRMAHGVMKPFPFDNPSEENGWRWVINFEKLEAAFNEKTRVLILNTPHNPTGKVFTEEELVKISDIVKKFPRVLVFTDEIYSNLVYDDHKHFMMANIDGMFDRTLTVDGCAKTFSATGWKVGWAIGGTAMINAVHVALEYNAYSPSVPLQAALDLVFPVAEKPYEGHSNYYEAHRMFYQRNRDRITGILSKANMKWRVLDCQGSFFACLYVKDVEVPEKYKVDEDGKPRSHDFAVSMYLTAEKKVTVLPFSPFSQFGNVQNFLRVALCKTEGEIDELEKIFV